MGRLNIITRLWRRTSVSLQWHVQEGAGGSFAGHSPGLALVARESFGLCPTCTGAQATTMLATQGMPASASGTGGSRVGTIVG